MFDCCRLCLSGNEDRDCLLVARTLFYLTLKKRVGGDGCCCCWVTFTNKVSDKRKVFELKGFLLKQSLRSPALKFIVLVVDLITG